MVETNEGMSVTMKKQGYYLYTFDPDDPNPRYPGVTKKVYNQVACFNKNGMNCELLPCLPGSILRRGIGTLPGVTDGIKWPEKREIEHPSFLYIRKPAVISKEFIEFLKGVKASFPDALVILELPTYPYDEEMKNPMMILGLRKDQKYRIRLKGLVDYIATMASDEFIFGIPTIRFINGIDLESVSKKHPFGSIRESNDMNIAFVAQFAPWHGADRMIKGLAEYYQNGGERNVILHMAGEGSESAALESQVKNEGLEDHVIFYGNLHGEDLDELYDGCSFAVASLGLHRIGHEIASTLKTREYLAKGLPFVYAGKVDVFESDPVDFAFQIPLDESGVDINAMLRFHDSLYEKESEEVLIDRIREYAQQNVDFSTTMKSAIQKIKSECS